VATFVTKMDAPVRQFASMAAEACGREPAGANEKAAFAFLRTLYQLERFNGIACQWSASFLIEYECGAESNRSNSVRCGWSNVSAASPPAPESASSAWGWG
jgi:hypothetical protein